ncbi:MAG TPA: sulfotransferase [Rhodanobacteraceae bacterium]
MTDDSVLGPIVTAIQSGDLGEAERLCSAYLGRVPDDPDVLLLLGLALQRHGRLREAVPAYARLTELEPTTLRHWANYATALRLAGDLPAAVGAAQRAAQLAPADADVLEQLGLLQLDSGDWAAARDTLLLAASKAPDVPRIRIRAARACVACRDSRSDAMLRPWRDWLPLADDLQLELAEALSQAGEMRPAIVVLEDLLGRAPDNVLGQLLLAKSCERVNRLPEAEALLQRLIAAGYLNREPGIQREILRQQAQLAERRHRYGAARGLLEDLGEDDADDYGHYFACARVCDKLGDADAAMMALQRAHARQVAEVQKYAAHLLQPDAPALPHTLDRVSAADYAAWPRLIAPDAAESPVFVVGFPRSGTTLLEQMLDAHPRLQSMDERPFFNLLSHQLEDVHIEVPRDLGQLDQRDCDELRKGYLLLACGKVARQWDTQLVDKNPLNLLWLPMIHRMYPDARFILALRHPCDVILSCYMQNFRVAPLAAASESLQRLASSYVAAMQSWLHHSELMHPSVLVSRYEDLIVDPHARTRAIAAFLGLADAEPMLHFASHAQDKGFIATPSYTQVIEPLNRRGIGRWQRYRRWFEPVLPILQPMLEHWGYDTVASGTVVA